MDSVRHSGRMLYEPIRSISTSVRPTGNQDDLPSQAGSQPDKGQVSLHSCFISEPRSARQPIRLVEVGLRVSTSLSWLSELILARGDRR